ncbi:MAG: hypothetical protein GY847_40370 [Proteobacteria bacterium]|nr:hypothetical protein [Pseudomonadota bacterium]
MTDHQAKDPFFVTAAMAEILISQNLAEEARRVTDQLSEREGESPRVIALYERLDEMSKQIDPIPAEPRGRDSVTVAIEGKTLKVGWEITEDGLALARRKVRYSGHSVLRLFSAVPGPRGVRTSTQDIELELSAASLDLNGLPHPAVHVAAVGFLGNTGEFVPLARSEPLVVSP